MALLDHSTEIGLESRKAADKHWERALFFSAVLLLLHLLDIRPSDIDAEGIKIRIDDTIAIQGIVAIIVVYHYLVTLSMRLQGAILSPYDIRRRAMQRFVRGSSGYTRDRITKRHRKITPKEIKKNAWWGMLFLNLTALPLFFGLWIFVVLSASVAVVDVWGFVKYANARYITKLEETTIPDMPRGTKFVPPPNAAHWTYVTGNRQGDKYSVDFDNIITRRDRALAWVKAEYAHPEDRTTSYISRRLFFCRAGMWRDMEETFYKGDRIDVMGGPARMGKAPEGSIAAALQKAVCDTHKKRTGL
jgi:uncharacterized membrane protein